MDSCPYPLLVAFSRRATGRFGNSLLLAVGQALCQAPGAFMKRINLFMNYVGAERIQRHWWSPVEPKSENAPFSQSLSGKRTTSQRLRLPVGTGASASAALTSCLPLRHVFPASRTCL